MFAWVQGNNPSVCYRAYRVKLYGVASSGCQIWLSLLAIDAGDWWKVIMAFLLCPYVASLCVKTSSVTSLECEIPTCLEGTQCSPNASPCRSRGIWWLQGLKRINFVCKSDNICISWSALILWRGHSCEIKGNSSLRGFANPCMVLSHPKLLWTCCMSLQWGCSAAWITSLLSKYSVLWKWA